MGGFTLLPVILAMSLIAAIAFLLNRDNGMNAEMIASQGDAGSARYTAEAGMQMVNAISQGKNCTGYTDLGQTTFGTGSFTAAVNPKNGTPVTLTATATTAQSAVVSLSRSNVIMHQTTPYTITLQPGTPGMDTSIGSANRNANHGADPNMTINNVQYVSLVQFDLSTIPAGAIIQSAQFSLYHASGSTDTASVFGMTRSWTEGTGAEHSGATWNSYDGNNAWTTAGGDYDQTSGVAITLPANNQWATWDLTTLTAAWVLGKVPNYGIALTQITSGNNTFPSSDNATAANRPKLVVTLLPPCGWVPAATGVTLQAIADTWIDEAHSGSNYGNSSSFTVDNANKSGRALVRFDVSGIAPGTLLKSATLRLFTGSFSPQVNSVLTIVNVYNSWTETGATWKTRDGTNVWSAGFGGIAGFGAGAPTSTSALSSSFTSGWVEWDITPLTQQWVDGVSPNYGAGVMIDTTSYVIFNSREFTVNQPQLLIAY